MVLHGTGLRINEGLGLCLDFVTEGKIDGPKSIVIHEKLHSYGLGQYHGYICLESQPALPSIRASERWTDRHGVSWRVGSVPRRPLKHRKKIDAKFYRYVPVFSADVWNILAKRANLASELLRLGKLGSDGRDYLLFDGLTASMFYSDLAKAYEALKLRQRSPHKLRHTFLTWFYEKVGEDMFLAEKVAGHRDKRDVERYNHLGELIGRERKLQQQKGRRFGLVDSTKVS